MILNRAVSRLKILAILALFAAAAPAQSLAQEPQQAFRATNYDVAATLDAGGQSISAVAKIDFQASQVSSNLRVELHPNLTVKEVKTADGKSLQPQRDGQNPLIVSVMLPAPVAAGGRVTLTYTYSGLLANEENSPVPGVRLASINHDGAYLLLPARWFPLTAYPTNRYTGTFRLNVPDTFAVAGTCKSTAPTTLGARNASEGARLLYEFHCAQAAPNGSFVAGNLQLNPKQAEGVSVNVFAPRAASANAGDFASDVARAAIVFSDMFGALPEPEFTLVQIPDNTVKAFAGPGLLLLSAHLWDPKRADMTIAGLVGAQWWGDGVLPATPGDVWISDGLAEYSEALYEEQNAGKEAELHTIDDFAVGALMYEDAAPVAQAARLSPYTAEYRSVVQSKGAMLFHMLRAQMGDAAFKALLRDFYAKYAGKNASIADFTAMAEQHAKTAAASGKTTAAAPNLTGFFAQWLNTTGVPEFTLDYVIYRTPKGFKIVGKIKQPLDTFHMPVQIRIDTEGNPETKSVDVTGTDSPFEVDTFGRPKPNGVHIDPNNFILKSSTSLRARAAIARGEDLAAQGKYYDAIKQYQQALEIQPGRALANFRMGEAFFNQKNYQAAANAFREAIAVVPDPSEKWTEVWGHIYLGKVFDVMGQRARAVNEYSKARQMNDNTSGAQAVAEAYLKKPYTEGTPAGAVSASASQPSGSGAAAAPATPAPSDDGRPKLKQRTPQ